MLTIYKLLANIKQLRPLKHSWNKRKCANIIFRERLSRNSRKNWISSKLSWWWTNTWAKIGSTAYKARKRRRSQQSPKRIYERSDSMLGVGRKCKANEQSLLSDKRSAQHVLRILSFDSECLTIPFIWLKIIQHD